MPGFDKSRIVGLTGLDLDEFTCAICLAILINPMFTQCCRQMFCKNCIKEWVSHHKTCPNDRKKLTMGGLRAVPRVMINLLDNMKIKCDYQMEGCPQVLKVGELSQHLTVCDYRPNQLCKNCGLIREFVSTHNCIQSLVTEKEKTEEKYLNLCEENSQLLSLNRENKQIISTLRNDLAHVNDDHQEILNKLKSEHMNTVDQIKSGFVRTFEDERKIHQDKLDKLRQAYEDLSEEKCSSLEKNIEELKSRVDNIITERINLNYQVYNLRQSNNNQNKVISNLENQLSNCKTGLKLSEGKCRSLEDTNKELQKELDSKIENLKEKGKIIFDLQYQLSDYKLRLKLFESKCQTLSVQNEEQTGELNSTTDKLKPGLVVGKPLNVVGAFDLLTEKQQNKPVLSTLRNDLAELKNYQQRIVELRSEHTKTVDELKDSYDSVFENQRKSHEKELHNLKQTISKQKEVVPDLEYQLSNYKSKLLLSENNCAKLKQSNQKLTEELNSTKVRLNSVNSKALGQFKRDYGRALEDQSESHQIENVLRQRYLNAEKSLFELTNELFDFKTHYSKLEKKNYQLREEQDIIKNANVLLVIVSALAILFAIIY